MNLEPIGTACRRETRHRDPPGLDPDGGISTGQDTIARQIQYQRNAFILGLEMAKETRLAQRRSLAIPEKSNPILANNIGP